MVIRCEVWDPHAKLQMAKVSRDVIGQAEPVKLPANGREGEAVCGVARGNSFYEVLISTELDTCNILPRAMEDKGDVARR